MGTPSFTKKVCFSGLRTYPTEWNATREIRSEANEKERVEIGSIWL